MVTTNKGRYKKK